MITGNLISTRKYLDIAARDALLAVGAAALANDAGPSGAKERARCRPADAHGPDRDESPAPSTSPGRRRRLRRA